MGDAGVGGADGDQILTGSELAAVEAGAVLSGVQHRAVELTRGRAAEIEYWPTFDPTQSEGSREARLAAYREVRDALARRIAERFGPRRP